LPEIRKVVTDTDCGLLVPDSDTKALCEAIKELVDDTDLRETFAKNALAAAKTYSWEAQDHILTDIYASLASV
jgi:glycosyltransferase involved in cell wall biosynthesis